MSHQDRLGNAIDPRTGKPAGGKVHGQPGGFSASQGQFCQCGAWLGTLGLEPRPEMYVAHLVEVFRLVKRVLRADGTVWLNLGDSYAQASARQPQSNTNHQYQHADPAFRDERYSGGVNISAKACGLKPKDLVGIPCAVAFALRADGWW